MLKRIIIIILLIFGLTKICFPAPIDSLEQLLKVSENSEKAKIYLQLALYYSNTSADKCIENANKALEYASIYKLKQDEADAFEYLGLGFFIKSDFSTAISYYKKSLLINQVLRRDLKIIQLNIKVGAIHNTMGDYAQALELNLKALEKLNIQTNTDEELTQTISDAYYSTGLVYTHLKDYNNAINYLQKAYLYNEKSNSQQQLSATCKAIGDVYLRKYNYIKANDYYEQALNLENALNNLYNKSNIYISLGIIQDSVRVYEKAEEFYTKAIELCSKTGNKEGLIKSLMNLANLYIKTNRDDKAPDLFTQSLRTAKEIGSKKLIQENYYLIYLLFYKKNNFKKALEYYRIYSDFKDSLYTENIAAKIAELQTQFKTRSQDSQIELLIKEKEKNDIELKSQKYLGYLLIAFVLIVSLLSFALYRQSRDLKRKNILLEKQNKGIIQAEQDLRNANKELKENAERFQALVHNLPVIVNAIGKNGRFVFWNKEAEKITGYRANEIVNNPLALDILYQDDDVVRKIEKDFTNKIEYRNFETRLYCKDGTQRIISWSKVPLLIPVPDWEEWSVGVDMTDRYNFEKSLLREKALLNSLINSIPDLIFYKDKNGKYLGVNPALCEFDGLKPEHYVGKTDFEIYPAELAKDFLETDLLILKNKTSIHISKWEVFADGKKALFDTIKIPFTDSEGSVLGIVGISRDITQRYKFEEELKIAKEKAEESDRLKSAFLANMSHEIRTPMNAIIGFSDLLIRKNISEEQRNEYIGYITASGKNLMNLIDDIIDIAKIEAGQIKIHTASCNINKVMREVYASFEQEKKRKDKAHLQLRLSIINPDEVISLETDQFRFRQILTNLIGNALKFTDIGYIEFGYTNIESENGEYLQFFVKDTGIGMPKEKHKIIFDRFGQIDTSYKRNHSGTGLGLAICKSLVELLGGQIWVDSEPDKGSIFYFTLPYKLTTEAIEEVKIIAKSGTTIWKNKTILIAEDEKMNFKLLEKVLQTTEVKLIWAVDGEQAVEMCRRYKEIDLVLMDIQLPKLSGYDAAIAIKKFRPELPIIAQTAFAMAGEKEKSVQLGCDGYITKPIMKEDLFEILQKFFNI